MEVHVRGGVRKSRSTAHHSASCLYRRPAGQAGGHLGPKSDGPPGAETLWRGLQKLDFGVRV